MQYITGYSGTLRSDESKPDGTPRKLLDVSRLRELGCGTAPVLREGTKAVYQGAFMDV